MNVFGLNELFLTGLMVSSFACSGPPQTGAVYGEVNGYPFAFSSFTLQEEQGNVLLRLYPDQQSCMKGESSTPVLDVTLSELKQEELVDGFYSTVMPSKNVSKGLAYSSISLVDGNFKGVVDARQGRVSFDKVIFSKEKKISSLEGHVNLRFSDGQITGQFSGSPCASF